MNMYKWIDTQIYQDKKKPFPLLSYPAVQMLYVTVKELVNDSTLQALGMKMIADAYDMPAATAYMDLSVEAEAFGARTTYATDEVPTIIGKLVEEEEDVDALEIPEIGAGRTGVCIDGVKKALKLITDRPIFAGCDKCSPVDRFHSENRMQSISFRRLYQYGRDDAAHSGKLYCYGQHQSVENLL